MKLISFSVEHYRRFAARSSLKLGGPMIALVGPNEAGKSSALRALARLGRAEDFATDEYPRRSGGQPRLSWQFEIDDGDRDLIRSIAGAGGLRRVTLERRAGSDKRHWGFDPPIVTDRAMRGSVHRMAQSLATTLAKRTPASRPNEWPDFAPVIEILGEGTEDLSTHKLDLLGGFVDALDAFIDSDSTDSLSRDSGLRLKAIKLMNELIELIKIETRPNPAVAVREVLEPRVPEIYFFGEEDRDLKSEYDLTQIVGVIPPALNHLAVFAELDLRALLQEIQEGRIADASTRRNAANRCLQRAFDQSWNQQGIAIQFEYQGSLLLVQATTLPDTGLSSIKERSDGFRWFAALLAYAHGWKERPILLVDEIETHLHYDAQADLIDVLSQQEFTSKVIYSTHSFGCLPSDLGTGVRVVRQLDAGTSTFENGYWQHGSGFSPMLVAMGAAATTFTPARFAVIAEGPSETILLPSLIRQAVGLAALRYQVAPGLASVAAAEVDELEVEAGRVAFLVDGDPAGCSILKMLVKGNIDSDRIVRLVDVETSEELEFEDLIDPAVYVSAINAELQLWQKTDEVFEVGDLGERFASKAVEGWSLERNLKCPDKAAVAQRIADGIGEQSSVNAARLETIRHIHEEFCRILKL